MKVAYLFPAGVKVEAGNLGSARLVDATLNRKILKNASMEGRLRCSCDWCLAPLRISEKRKLFFAHKPRTAAKDCSYKLFKDGKPVLLLPLTQEMVDLHREAHETWHVLFFPIQPAVLKSLAPWLVPSAWPAVPLMEPPPGPGPLEGPHIH